jgi:predicted DNA-binding protein
MRRFLRNEDYDSGAYVLARVHGYKGTHNTMTQIQDRIYNRFIGFRSPDDFLQRFSRFSRNVGRSKSQVCRYLIGQCLSAYEADKDAIAKIRQEIL